MASPAPDDAWGELLLDGLPGVDLLDDLKLDGGLPPMLDPLDCLDLEELGGGSGGGSVPASSSDLLESLQLDAAAFSQPAASSGARHSPADSGSASPVAPLLAGGAAAPPTGPRTAAAPRSTAGGAQASPASSESENSGEGRHGSPAAAASQRGGQAGSAAAAQPQKPQSDEDKRLARMQRNRENAQLSRQRKKAQLADLEARCGALARHNAQLAGAVHRLTAENGRLRQQLALVCQQAGKGSPAGSTPAGSTPTTAAAQPGKAAAAAAAGCPLLPAVPLLPFALPGFALAAQQAVRAGHPSPAGRPAQAAPAAPAAPRPAQPAPAAAAAPTRPAAADTAAAARPAKRAKTAAAGASTAMLALFTLFMFASPYSPAPATSTGGAGAGGAAGLAAAAGAQRALQALPQALPAGPPPAGGGRRRLQALPAAQAPELAPPGGGRLQQLLNSTLQALLEQPGNAALEAAALARLRELGPVALLLDGDGGPAASAAANPLAASHAFPRLAGQLFGAAGLEVPQVCQKVLEFEAADVPHAARSRRSLERFVLGATGFKGRSLAAAAPGGDSPGGGALGAGPQPLRIGQAAESGERGDPAGDEPAAEPGASTALLPAGGAGGGPVLVSVLLPANASGGGELASADKVFVVLLHPQSNYATYSCALPRAVAL